MNAMLRKIILQSTLTCPPIQIDGKGGCCGGGACAG